MSNHRQLHILWTNDNPTTAENMVFMYALNSLKHGWWDQVTLVIWGATARLAAENGAIQGRLQQLQQQGVGISACKACANELGVTEMLQGLGFEVKYWGQPLTELLQSGAPLLTV